MLLPRFFLLTSFLTITVVQPKRLAPRPWIHQPITSEKALMYLRGGGSTHLPEFVSKAYLMISAAQGTACASAPDVTMEQFGRGEPKTNADFITFQFRIIGLTVLSQVIFSLF